MGSAALLPGLGHGVKGQALPRKAAGCAALISCGGTCVPGSRCFQSVKALLVRPPTGTLCPGGHRLCGKERTQNSWRKLQGRGPDPDILLAESWILLSPVAGWVGGGGYLPQETWDLPEGRNHRQGIERALASSSLVDLPSVSTCPCFSMGRSEKV